MNSQSENSVKKLATDGIISVILIITGMLKLPSFIPGAEFQLSAPFAVSIAKNFGFKRYLMIGIVASICSFILGVQNIFNIMVAMIYRIVVGIILLLFKNCKVAFIICGPCGTLVSRIVLALLLNTDMSILIIHAIPGMIFTAIMAPFMIEGEKKIFAKYGKELDIK